MHHADLYRLDHTTEVSDLAIDELLDDGVVLVEWGDAVDLGPALRVDLTIPAADAEASADDVRIVDITVAGERWTQRWPRLREALQRWATTS
jgi:tRNA A37 threonylcarbamoyladenosine biosynthesis protein TsaE